MKTNTTNATAIWFGGLRYTYTGALPATDLEKLSLTANVYAGGGTGPAATSLSASSPPPTTGSAGPSPGLR